MTQRELDQLSEKYARQACTPEEAARLKKWADVSYERHGTPFADEAEAEATGARLWRGVQLAIRIPRNRVGPLLRWAAVAAALLLIGGCFALYRRATVETADGPRQGVESRNIARSQQKVFLADGSTVVLEQGASIVVDEKFGPQARTVHLTGEAFFEIKSDPTAPFRVYSGGLVTEVLGTSFRIKPQPGGDQIEVSVKAGRVSVYASEGWAAADQSDGVVLTPNQKALFDPKLKTIRQGIVDAPDPITPTTSGFRFEEATVEVVLDRMRKTYGLEIIVPNPVVNRCAFTGDLSGLPMHQQLELVCASIGARLQIRGAVVFIIGDGCE